VGSTTSRVQKANVSPRELLDVLRHPAITEAVEQGWSFRSGTNPRVIVGELASIISSHRVTGPDETRWPVGRPLTPDLRPS
jgi:hypothetical protein